MRVFRLITILFLIPVSVYAQSVLQEPISFNENLREEAEISGALIAGLQRGSLLDVEDAVDLFMEVPGAWVGDVACLRVSTSNGLYDGIAEYDLVAGDTVLPLRFPTEHADYLLQRPDGATAAFVSRGVCSGPAQETAIVSWSTSGSRETTLFLNAFRADRVYVYLGTDAQAPVECTSLVGEARTAYDTRCDLGELALSSAIELEVLAITNGQPSDPISVQVTPMLVRP